MRGSSYLLRCFFVFMMAAATPAMSQTAASQPAIHTAVTMPAAPVLKNSTTSPLWMSAQAGVLFRYTILPATTHGVRNLPVLDFTADALPAGLALDRATGVVSGTPTQAGTFSVPISATNSVGVGKAELKLTVYPEHPTTATTVMHLKGTTASPFGYVEFLPGNYYLDLHRTFPVVIDLCGAGNIAQMATDPWGDNTQNKLWELTWQAGRTNKSGGTIFDDADCIILSPIPPDWWEKVPLDRFFDFAFTHYRIDRSRVYLVGLSAGGDGVLDYVAAHGKDLAACVFGAISHDSPPSHHDWKPFLQIPTWIYENWKDPFDGGKDDVNRRHSILFCNKLAQMLSGSPIPTDMLSNYPQGHFGTTQPTRDFTGVYTVADGWKWSQGMNAVNGPPLRLTQFKTKNHGGWNQAYDNPELWKWVFAQRRKIDPKVADPATQRH